MKTKSWAIILTIILGLNVNNTFAGAENTIPALIKKISSDTLRRCKQHLTKLVKGPELQSEVLKSRADLVNRLRMIAISKAEKAGYQESFTDLEREAFKKSTLPFQEKVEMMGKIQGQFEYLLITLEMPFMSWNLQQMNLDSELTNDWLKKLNNMVMSGTNFTDEELYQELNPYQFYKL